ncbi:MULTISPECIES: IS256 family transposase [unclassified Sporosarcina]|uniref:IS256 family transposase n=1 Tax=unclassified Sporosarcina TaxID=2647733 RepID=UPI00203B9EC2|nr:MULTISPECIES: IS256 family transposase [unclassified Sporosarcina]GKV67493.1 transposase for insertion sequence element IS256 in transposon Tn4001 [Sporosarcina sp. NCCP-2331]GLB57858.1 transposase for insertion sequence element IS256 in transposon Tn4001 [Sporosarcina sp. NCCP-2378]
MTLFNYLNLNPDKVKDSVLHSDMDAVVKSAVVLALEQLMEKERDEHLQAASYERTSARKDYRNGYYERELMISIGRINLRVPRTREGDFSPSVFEKYARVDQAFVLGMLEMVVNGVSTRKVTNVVETLCGQRVSKSFVSSLTAKLDPVVNEWANRPLNVMSYRYLFMDAMYIKVRENKRVVSKAVYIATAINSENRREVIGLRVDAQESKKGWQTFIQSLKGRGLQSPKLIVSDAHEGLRQAIQQEFTGTSWQRCSVHFKRNIFDKLPKKDVQQFKLDVRRIFQALDVESAREEMEHVASKYADEPKVQKALETLEEGFDDAVQFLNEPLDFARFLSSTNHLERLNQEVRRREQVIRIFPNEQSAFRLIGAVLMKYDEKERTKKPMKLPEKRR